MISNLAYILPLVAEIGEGEVTNSQIVQFLIQGQRLTQERAEDQLAGW
jgi:hypothetical protein